MATSKYSREEVVRFFMGEREFPTDNSSSNDESVIVDQYLNSEVKFDISEVEMSDNDQDPMVDPLGSSSCESELSSDNSDDNDNESNTITDKEEMSEFGSDSSGTTSSNPESSDSADDDELNNNDVGRRERGSSHRGRARGRGRQRSKAVGQGKGLRSAEGRKTSRRASLTIPSSAKTITVTDTTFVRGVNSEFLPIREPGPHIPDGTVISPLSLFELYFTMM